MIVRGIKAGLVQQWRHPTLMLTPCSRTALELNEVGCILLFGGTNVGMVIETDMHVHRSPVATQELPEEDHEEVLKEEESLSTFQKLRVC